MKKIIQITSGRGPIECCRVVARVLEKMIKKWKKETIIYETLATYPAHINGTLSSALLLIDASEKELSIFLNSWLGTVRWIAISPYRKYNKRKNWYVGIEAFDIPAQMLWYEKDVRYDTSRASGPGGQNVNKVETAVRGTHLPSGISVFVMDSRSQSQNKKICIERLKAKLEEHFIEEMIANQQSQWQEHNALERGNEIRIFEERL
jgi:peptide chain release factor